VWLEPSASIHPAVRNAVQRFDAVVIGPGSFFTSLMPTLLVDGVAEALAAVKGPIVVVSNLLTEGQGMRRFSAADEVAWVSRTIGRTVDVVIANQGQPSREAIDRYAAEDKHPLPLGALDADVEAVVGDFWQAEIARHDRRRLSYAVWSVLSRRLLT
jgi:uncharacterized cofD-like protein